MKTREKYRFTLQWGADTAEKIRAGDFLDSLGNHKSELVVLAVTEYLKANPEVADTGIIHQIIIKPSYTQEQMKAIVLAILEEKLTGMASVTPTSDSLKNELIVNESDVEEMLNHLDIFS